MTNETKPVAWRVKDYADGWMICSETAAKLLIERNSALIEPLYSAAALASRDAEIERLRGELDALHWAIMGGEDVPGVLAEMVAAECNRLSAALGEAERAINRAKEAVEDQDDIELVGSLAAALSTLKTAREG